MAFHCEYIAMSPTSSKTTAVVPLERVERAILLIRGQKVVLDADLAALYGVPTKRFNEQVKRNKERFPDDFMFRLTAEEKSEVVANCDHLKKLKFSATLPYAFTELRCGGRPANTQRLGFWRPRLKWNERCPC